MRGANFDLKFLLLAFDVVTVFFDLAIQQTYIKQSKS